MTVTIHTTSLSLTHHGSSALQQVLKGLRLLLEGLHHGVDPLLVDRTRARYALLLVQMGMCMCKRQCWRI